jgi:hypothetical protein
VDVRHTHAPVNPLSEAYFIHTTVWKLDPFPVSGISWERSHLIGPIRKSCSGPPQISVLSHTINTGQCPARFVY